MTDEAIGFSEDICHICSMHRGYCKHSGKGCTMSDLVAEGLIEFGYHKENREGENMCFKKKYTEEEVQAIVDSALESQRARIEEEVRVENLFSDVEDLKKRVDILENKKVGFGQ